MHRSGVRTSKDWLNKNHDNVSEWGDAFFPHIIWWDMVRVRVRQVRSSEWVIVVQQFFSYSITRTCYFYMRWYLCMLDQNLIFAPCTTIISFYFEERRSLANGLMVSFSGIGNLIFPYLYRYLKYSPASFIYASGRGVSLLFRGQLYFFVSKFSIFQ
jgi:hypothetical protein